VHVRGWTESTIVSVVSLTCVRGCLPCMCGSLNRETMDPQRAGRRCVAECCCRVCAVRGSGPNFGRHT